MSEKNKPWLLILTFLVAAILRFYKLGEIPNGLYQDETAIAYNAYSIAQTGKDEHGQFMPIYFKSFGDYKLPVYIYMTVLSEIIFGVTAFAVRFPSALFSFLTVVIFYFLLRSLYKEGSIPILATTLLAINPWHIHYSRATFEVSIALFLFISGLYLIIRQGKFGLYIGTFCFIIAMYTYNLTRLLSPLFFISILMTYKKHFSKSKLYVSVGLFILFCIPFFITVGTRGGLPSASGTLIFSSAAVKAPLLELKSYAAEMPFISKLLLSMPLLILWQYIQNIAAYFSVSFFFITGSLHGNHGIGNIGLFYLFEFPFIIIGLLFMMKNYSKYGIILSWAVLTVLSAALTRDVPQATRSFFLIPTLIIASAEGLNFIKHKKIAALLALVIVFNIVYYLFSYYVRFPVLYAKQWRSADREVGQFLKTHAKEYDRILIDTDAGLMYSSVLFYTGESPVQFQKTAVWTPDNSEGFSFPVSFGKYTYKQVSLEEDLKKPNTLIITSSDKHGQGPAQYTFYYPQRPVVIANGQNIITFPVRDAAYTAYVSDTK